jgi:outer membrane protein assembly factor BamB
MYRLKQTCLALTGFSLLLVILVLASAVRRNSNPSEDKVSISPTPTTLITSSPTPRPTRQALPVKPSPAVEGEAQRSAGKIEDYSTLEWHQDAHDPARTGYIKEEPTQPWSLLWTWNGPDSQGGTGNHFYDAPPEARPVTGGCCVFAPAGNQGLFALQKNNGHPLWNLNITAFNAAPAYDPETGYLYAGGENGFLYKIDTRSGDIAAQYHVGSALDKALLLADGYLYAVSIDGGLHKIDLEEMTAAWVYSPSSAASTPPAYSSRYGLIIYCTSDLKVHAIDSTDGSVRWVTNPSPHAANVGAYTFAGYWPVVADNTGIVFVRMNLGISALWSGPNEGNVYPDTNRATKQYLEDNPHLQNLYALHLENGEPAFIPAVGYGGVETTEDSSKELAGGPVPVIRRIEDGSEVAYSFFRSGQENPPDGRWDSHIGEMVLNNHTIPGMEAGDLRFVHFDNSHTHITDEQCPISMAGGTIFHAHWGASESIRITDRSTELGTTYADPIRSEPHPVIIRRMQACPSYDPVSHWTSCDLILYADGRTWKGPGWWVYWDILDPPTPLAQAYSEGHLPRYTYVSDGLVVVSGNGGELMVFAHSGGAP